MSHIFDDKKFAKLDSPERKKAMPVVDVLELLPHKNGVIADVGCGIGYFSKPFAAYYKEVYAIDISALMIDELKKRITEENISPLLGDFNTLLDNDSLDVFFTATVIHEIEDLEGFTKQAIHKLKSEGTIVYLDFEKNGSQMGPPNEKRIASSEVVELFKTLSLRDIKTYPIKDNFYIVLGRK